MRLWHFVVLVLVLGWWFNPYATRKISSDVPYQLHYVEKVVGSPSSDKLPMLIAIHGAGGDEENLLYRLKLVDADFRYIGFRGPESRSPGYTWMRYLPGGSEQAQQGYMSKLDDIAFSIAKGSAEVSRKFPTIGKPVLVGFSAGAQVALFLAGAYPEYFSAIYVAAGKFQLVDSLESYFEFGNLSPVYGYGGSSDSLVSAEATKDAIAILQGYGRTATFTRFDGGHTIPQEALDDISARLNEF